MFDEILLNPYGVAVHDSTGPGPKATNLSAGAQAGVSPWYGVYFKNSVPFGWPNRHC